MKLSLSWIFDHINGHWQNVDVSALVGKINQITAEIEDFSVIHHDLHALALAELIAVNGSQAQVQCPEWKVTVELPARKDAQVESWYLIKKNGQTYSWAMASDFHSSKDHVLPAIDCTSEDTIGGWKKSFESSDYILQLDNKSITHRPDLWGHRGFAREIAALLNMPLKPLEEFIVQKKVIDIEAPQIPTTDLPLTILNQAPDACKRIAGVYIDQVAINPSQLAMASRLCRVDSKPINFIVDATNYVMLDLGQPMHAFDAQQLDTHLLVPRFARSGEKLTLLDGTTLELTSQDLIITDGKKPLALAGVMGGSASGVTRTTKDIIVEAACFDATTIRKTAARHKIRTESSARFEKSLDSHQIVPALERFLFLAQRTGMTMKVAPEIVTYGKPSATRVITVSHSMLEQRLGVAIPSDFVLSTLKKLGFEVNYVQNDYVVTVPSFRASKDITVYQDIIEEIGRFFGYSSLERVLPFKQVTPFDLTSLKKLRTIKRVMAYALSMRELYNYALYDEEFLQQLQWQPTQETPAVQNPVSEHWRRLVTSLVPHLLKAIAHNSADHDSLRFFEWARTWSKAGSLIVEKKSLAAVIYEKKKAVDFYDAKAEVEKLFQALGLEVTWKKPTMELDAWYMPHQTAILECEGHFLGFAGKVNQLFLNTIAAGDLFILELDGGVLLEAVAKITKYKAGSKYPDSIRDISMLISQEYTTDAIAERIKKIDARIIQTALIDFFEKPEWVNQRSITMRLTLQDQDKTLTTQEVDAIVGKATNMLQSLGATIR